MQEKHDILGAYYLFIAQTCNKILKGKDEANDLCNEIYLYLYRIDLEKLKGLHERNELKFYIVRTINNEAFRARGYIATTFKGVVLSGGTERAAPDTEYEIHDLSKLTELEKGLLALYKMKTRSEIIKLTGISKKTLIKKYRLIFKKLNIEK